MLKEDEIEAGVEARFQAVKKVLDQVCKVQHLPSVVEVQRRARQALQQQAVTVDHKAVAGPKVIQYVDIKRPLLDKGCLYVEVIRSRCLVVHVERLRKPANSKT